MHTEAGGEGVVFLQTVRPDTFSMADSRKGEICFDSTLMAGWDQRLAVICPPHCPAWDYSEGPGEEGSDEPASSDGCPPCHGDPAVSDIQQNQQVITHLVQPRQDQTVLLNLSLPNSDETPST